MKMNEFANLVRSLEYLAVDEVIRDVRSTKKYSEKLGRVYITDNNFTYLTEKAKWQKKFIKDGWYKELSHREIIELGNNNKEFYKDLYNLIKCFYSNYYRSSVNLCSFTEEDLEKYKKLAQKYMNELVNE